MEFPERLTSSLSLPACGLREAATRESEMVGISEMRRPYRKCRSRTWCVTEGLAMILRPSSFNPRKLRHIGVPEEIKKD